jgi:hypothetical protein
MSPVHRRDLRRILSLAFAALILVAGASAARAAGNIVFEDSQFLDANWAVFPLRNPAGDFTYTALQSPTGGASGEYRSFSHAEPTPQSVCALAHVRLGMSYDPAALRAISFVEFESNVACFDGGGSSGLGLEALIVQDGVFYEGPGLYAHTGAYWPLLVHTSWTPNEYTSGTGTHPDFSVLGSPLSFGFVTYSVATGTPFVAHGGVDNWWVMVSSDFSVGARSRTWGGLKALYR